MPKPLERLEQFAVDVIMDRRYGKRAALLRTFLHGLSILYRRIMRIRLRWYENRRLAVYSLGCQVISVGNLTVGGTGKTPWVEKIAKELTKAGRKVSILSRGYKSQKRPLWDRMKARIFTEQHEYPPRLVSDGKTLFLDSRFAGDEPFMLAHNCDGVSVVVDKNRVKCGKFAIEKFGSDTLILDDGFQYLTLKERYDIVLVDRETPFGNGHLLPRGTLREPIDHLKRANLIVITKCDGTPIDDLKKQLRELNIHAPMIECRHQALHLQNVANDEQMPLEFLKELKISALSGIARPESFEAGLKKLGADIIYSRAYEDHHRFSEDELQSLMTRSRNRGAKAIITTEKDAVRIPRMEQSLVPIYFLRVEIEILTGHEHFENFIKEISRQNVKDAAAQEAWLKERCLVEV
ncbi:MAG: tetraacyldisaccharide 4'-kinase [Verrucomicrobiota bacterium]